VGRFGADRGATRSPAHRSRAARRLCQEARRRTAPAVSSSSPKRATSLPAAGRSHDEAARAFRVVGSADRAA
jgi:hypothetical protein